MLSVKVAVPGAGRLELLQTSRRARRSASAAARGWALTPGPDAFVLSRRKLAVRRGGTFTVRLRGRRSGQRLLRARRAALVRSGRRTTAVRVNLYATFTPEGGKPRSVHLRFALPRPGARARWALAAISP